MIEARGDVVESKQSMRLPKESFLNSDKEIYNTVRWAVDEAKQASRGDEHSHKDSTIRFHRRILLLAQKLRLRFSLAYGNDQFRIQINTEDQEVDIPRESILSAGTNEVERKEMTERVIWDVVFELADKYHRRFETSTPNLDHLNETLDNLAIGRAEHFLLVTSNNWMKHIPVNVLFDRCRSAAQEWYRANAGEKVFYVATIPFMSDWNLDICSDRECVIWRFDPCTGKFLCVSKSPYDETYPR